MSYGPLHNCYRCKAKLDINDPANGGYCGGHHCLSDPDRLRGSSTDLLQTESFGPSFESTSLAPKKPTTGNRKQRRREASKARRKK